ncbi:reverse transcriptase domain-containing protein [Staphylococcus equorum]|uniref:reverse transcriptase domain-containing protein n=1 Tax=Staphylococcus equorum TaxID=246432 RepID=UPI0009BDDE01|nr:reverse transcriptase domain-containing protein [Staphylococcus equorum]
MVRTILYRKLRQKYEDKTIQKVSDEKFTLLPMNKQQLDKGKYMDKKNIISKEDNVHIDYVYKLIECCFDINVPDRNIIMKKLVNYLPHLSDIKNVTLIRFDIQNFFQSIDIKKFYKELKRNKKIRLKEVEYIENALKNQKVLYPGISISNIISEVLGGKLDIEIKKKYPEIIFYSRYVDDFIIIFNEIIEEDKLVKEIKTIVEKTLGNSASIHTKNNEKYHYMTSRVKEKHELIYLGYKFYFNKDLKITHYGISTEKIKKYKKILEKIMRNYSEDKNYHLFKERLDTFYKRSVFYGNRNSTKTWFSYGISQNYKELKGISLKQIDSQTKKLLSGSILFDINNNNNIIEPKKLSNMINKLINDKHFIKLFYKNKAIIFNSNIGLNNKQIEKLATKINFQLQSNNYNEKVFELLQYLMVLNKKSSL